MRIKIFAAIVLIPIMLQAQDETLFGNGEFESSGYGGPAAKLTMIDGDPALMVGGFGAWLVNHAIIIGGGGWGLTTNHDSGILDTVTNTNFELNFGYGGVMLGYIHNGSSLIHFEGTLLIGGGGINLRRDNDYDYYERDDDPRHHDAVFVIEPSVNLMMNLTNWFRAGVGASYRYVGDVETTGYTNSDFGGPSAQLIFKFGSF